MQHCIRYDCGLNGSNHRAEADSQPLWLCPECLAKVCWATGADPAERYRKLAGFCATNGLATEAEFYRKSLERLNK
jgi:archaemetzincin